jgi:hypothetical protein
MEMRNRLVGTRLAAAGTILYFLEWVAISFLPDTGDPSVVGGSAADLVDAYSGHAGAVAFAAAWFALVLLGRILFVVALRKSLRASGYDSLVADFAVQAMAVSVTLELVAFGIQAGAGWISGHQADASAVLALDAAGLVLFSLIFIPLGVSVLAAAATMYRSLLFARWLTVLGLVSGATSIVGGILSVTAAGEPGPMFQVGDMLTTVGVVAFWVWLIVTSAVLWRQSGPSKSTHVTQRAEDL